jgi:hypothetical protein
LNVSMKSKSKGQKDIKGDSCSTFESKVNKIPISRRKTSFVL